MNRSRNRVAGRFRNRWIVATVSLVVAPLVVGFGAGFAAYLGSERELAAIDPLRQHNPTNTSLMRSRAAGLGALGYAESLFGENPFDIEWSEIVSISPILVCSVVKSEDTNFFEHHGFAWQELVRASLRYALARPGGGSTITQQLAKNLFLGTEITLWRKLREALIARRMERTLSKERIIEIYLNVIEWGEGVWGVSAASRHYFDTSPAELDAFEAVFLTSLVPAPLKPFTGWNLERFRQSNRRVLDRIYYSGLVSGSEWSEARSRLEAAHTTLANGRSASESLSVPASAHGAPLPPIRYQPDPLPLPAALAEGCGRQRERAEEAMRGRIEGSERHGVPELLGSVAAAPQGAAGYDGY